MADIWDRQPYDTPKSYHAFTHYFELSYSDRTIDRAHVDHWRACEGYKGRTKPIGVHWRHWSAANKWVDRAAAHDEHIAKKRRLRRAEDLDKAMDDTAAIARAARTRIAQRLAGLDPQDIPAGQLGTMLRQLNIVELRSLGWSPSVEVKGQLKHEHQGDLKATIGLDPDLSRISLPDLLAIRDYRHQIEGILQKGDNGNGDGDAEANNDQ